MGTGQELAERIDGYFGDEGHIATKGLFSTYRVTRELWEDDRPFVIMVQDLMNKEMKKITRSNK